ncbi:MAG: 5-bromo-4-chloroindolyl phosphate hydrolysis family protein [Clostridia bacterium]
MDNHDFSNIGQQIKSMVLDAINTMDFKKLNQDIGSTVNSALNELREGIKSAGQGARPEAQRPKEPPAKAAPPPPVARSQAYINPKPSGSVSGVLCIVFGAIGLGLAGIALAVSAIVGAVNNSLAALGGTALGYIAPLAVLCGCLMTRGVYLRKRVARFRQYTRQLRGRTYCQLKELADHLGKSVKYVAKDVRKMIRLGMFPEGRLDDQQSCLMLDNETYQQYLSAQEAHRQQKMAQAKEEQAVLSPEDRAVIEEGRRYITQIREMNDAIPGEEVSAQLEQLEMVTSKIFSHVERHPKQIPEIRKFMSYYLPTTLKLVKAYREFDSQPIAGETISSAKEEIQNTLDTINLAFVKLLDSLFEDAAFDISTDITVLQTMLAQEGLTKKDFG